MVTEQILNCRHFPKSCNGFRESGTSMCVCHFSSQTILKQLAILIEQKIENKDNSSKRNILINQQQEWST